MNKLRLLLCLCLLPLLSGCKSGSQPSAALNPTLLNGKDSTKGEDPRRLLFAQIVEDDKAGKFDESGIIEGKPFKQMLRELVPVSHDQVRKQTNRDITFDDLMDQPGLRRGQVITLDRGIVLEVGKAEAPPEYGLPPGYSILPAVFIDSARDVYALRILSPPKSNTYERLLKGIENDELPVIRVTGYFFKLYARKTSDESELPWRRPLLICPEPEFAQAVHPRKVAAELIDAKMDRKLPSLRIDTPGAEERLVLEILADGRIRAGARDLSGDLDQFISDTVSGLRSRLPADQRAHAAAVVLIQRNAKRDKLNAVLEALKRAGVNRLAVKTSATP